MNITEKIDKYLNERRLPAIPNVGEQIEVYNENWVQPEEIDVVSISQFPVYIGKRENGEKIYITYNLRKHRWEEK